MQALPTQGLLLNRRHPDAMGCFFAMPVIERGGEKVRDLTGGRAGLGQPAWTGTRSFTNLRRGRAITTSAGNYIETPVAGTPWTNNFSAMVTFLTTAHATGSALIRCGGFVLSVFPGFLRLYTDAAGVIATNTIATADNIEYVVGVRWRASDNLVSFFQNGVKVDVAGAAIATVATPIAVSHWPTSDTLTGSVRDVRIWERYLPDAAFERYYANPSAFYTSGRQQPLLKAFGGGGRMIPFLHPSLPV